MVDAAAPARKKNAVSQFRSRRKRIKHPLESEDDASSSALLLPSAGYEYSTPPRNNMPLPVTPEDDETPKPITPEQQPHLSIVDETPSLLDALTFAARPSPDDSKKSNTKSLDATTLPPSYVSSIEAMAAHVEAFHTKNKTLRNNTTKTTKSPVKLTPLSSKIIKGEKKRRGGSNSGYNGGNISPLGSRKLYSSNSSVKSSSSSSTRRTSNKQKSRVPPTTTPARVWLIALPILVPFLLCETFLLLLVYMFKGKL